MLPPNVLAMKEKVLASVKPPVQPLPKIKNSRPYWFVLSGAVAVLILFISQYQYNARQKTTGFSMGSPMQAPAALDMAAGLNEACSGSGCEAGTSESTALSNLDGDKIALYKEESGAQRAFNVTPGNQQGNSAQDTREFLKYDYYATLNTRKVQQTSDRLQTIVRGHGGRIDSIAVQEKFGSISFVIPKSSFEAFKNEVKGLVHVKFYEERVNGQNLLPEKVAIEDSAKSAQELLASLESELATLSKQHNAEITGLQKQLNGVVASINKLRREVATSAARQEQIKRDLSRLYGTQASLQKQIAQEHQNFNTQEADIEYKIKETKLQIIDISQQDKNLLQDVETVEGRISVEWVSVFEMIQIYCPYYWVWILLVCALAFLFYYFSKRRTIKTL